MIIVDLVVNNFNIAHRTYRHAGSTPDTFFVINSKSTVVYSAIGIGAATAILVGGVIIVAVPKPATATPAYAAQTKLACGRCHASPAGGGSLTNFGKAFAANGHKLPKKQ